MNSYIHVVDASSGVDRHLVVEESSGARRVIAVATSETRATEIVAALNGAA
ncbi:hypothetical protein [Nocardia cyriacigeorgica]|uniref:hypothetical protein n=1 Tax=Nocardia cyriacigeorgica TaxID=135487 RepID=UPI002456188C|nr:hypothetical protein [Nocardia cyriacigeorgica]